MGSGENKKRKIKRKKIHIKDFSYFILSLSSEQMGEKRKREILHQILNDFMPSGGKCLRKLIDKYFTKEEVESFRKYMGKKKIKSFL